MSGCDDESAAIARLERAIARDRPGPLGLHFDVSVDSSDLYVVLAALKRETERAILFQRERAELADQLHGTPCAQIAWQQERETLLAALKRETEGAERFQQERDALLAQLAKAVEALTLISRRQYDPLSICSLPFNDEMQTRSCHWRRSVRECARAVIAEIEGEGQKG